MKILIDKQLSQVVAAGVCIPGTCTTSVVSYSVGKGGKVISAQSNAAKGLAKAASKSDQVTANTLTFCTPTICTCTPC